MMDKHHCCSLTHLDELKKTDPRKLVPCTNNNWTISDAIRDNPVPIAPPKISIRAFNHVSREVLSLEKSKEFYCDILGFHVIPRPPFDCEGYWLYGHGLNMHLVATSTPKQRQDLKVRRIQHFSYALPRVDHIAFITDCTSSVRAVLDHHDVYYKHEMPSNTGIEQIFLFDPDGNVIEISNCAPEVGKTTCLNLEPQAHEYPDVAKNQDSENIRERLHSLGYLSQATDCEGDDLFLGTTDADDYSLGVTAMDDNVHIVPSLDLLSEEEENDCNLKGEDSR